MLILLLSLSARLSGVNSYVYVYVYVSNGSYSQWYLHPHHYTTFFYKSFNICLKATHSKFIILARTYLLQNST